MSRREKREKYRDHDSRRWLKHHLPRYSDPFRYLLPNAVWGEQIDMTLLRWAKTEREHQAMTGSPSYRAGSCGASAESALIRISRMDGGKYEAICAALAAIRRSPDGKMAGWVIRKVCLERVYTAKEVAQRFGAEPGMVKEWVARFKQYVALYLDFVGGDRYAKH